MKIVLDEKDNKYIERINYDIENGEEPILFCSEKRNYSVSFDVIDIAKANNFILEIVMNPNHEHAKEIEEKIGIRFTSINYSAGDSKLDELKHYLAEFMERINRI